MTESIEEASSSDDEMMVDDHELEKFTSSLDQFKPIIPESVTKFYMQKSGLQTDDERVVKLLSLSVQKFMTEVINDCFQLHKLREKSNNRATGATTAATTSTTTTAVATTTTTTTTSTTPIAAAAVGNTQSSTADTSLTNNDPTAAGALAAKKPTTTNTLTLNELTHVLEEYGINVKKNFYYT